MAQVDKIKIGATTYNIGASGDATNTFTSGDSADGSAKAWTSVNTVTTGETNKSIFNKMSSMFKNIRYLYNCLGRGSFSDTNTVAKALAGKAASSHSHGVGDLPTSASQTNSNSYVPTSALVYSMNETLKSLNDAIIKFNKIYTNGPDAPRYTTGVMTKFFMHRNINIDKIIDIGIHTLATNISDTKGNTYNYSVLFVFPSIEGYDSINGYYQILFDSKYILVRALVNRNWSEWKKYNPQ